MMPAAEVDKKPAGDGAMNVHSFTKMFSQEHPSIAASNAYAQHLAKSLVGFATYCPGPGKKDASGNQEDPGDRPYTFPSASGGQRVINLHESIPIYFKADMDSLDKVPTVRLSESPLDKEVLDRELHYRSMDFEELTVTSKNLGVYESSKDKTRPSLVRRCLEAEFTVARVADNLGKS